MRFLGLLIWSASLILGLCWSCSGDPNQNAFPKRLPVDKRAEQQQETIRAERISEDNLSSWRARQAEVKALLEGEATRYYTVRDGDGGFVAESTTFYQEETRKTPLKTKIIYLTGDYDNVYWLGDQVVWVERNRTDYIFRGQTLVVALENGNPFDPTQSDKNNAAKVPPLAQRLLALPAANLNE